MEISRGLKIVTFLFAALLHVSPSSKAAENPRICPGISVEAYRKGLLEVPFYHQEMDANQKWVFGPKSRGNLGLDSRRGTYERDLGDWLVSQLALNRHANRLCRLGYELVSADPRASSLVYSAQRVQVLRKSLEESSRSVGGKIDDVTIKIFKVELDARLEEIKKAAMRTRLLNVGR